jgi:hypothetical protein
MLPFSNNPHLIADLSHERYNDLRREADAWRLGSEALRHREEDCVPAESRLQRALATLRLRLSGTPRSEVVFCP